MRFIGSKYAKNAFAAVAAPPQEPHPFGRRSKTVPFKQKYWLRHCKMLKWNTDTDYYRDRGAKLPTYCVT